MEGACGDGGDGDEGGFGLGWSARTDLRFDI